MLKGLSLLCLMNKKNGGTTSVYEKGQLSTAENCKW